MYGLYAKDDRGHRVVDSNFILNRFRFAATPGSGTGGSETMADLSGKKTVEVAVCVNPSSPYHSPHDVSRSGNTISWGIQTYSFTRCASLILVFLYT